jgi:hypothetical protein
MGKQVKSKKIQCEMCGEKKFCNSRIGSPQVQSVSSWSKKVCGKCSYEHDKGKTVSFLTTLNAIRIAMNISNQVPLSMHPLPPVEP